MMKHIKNDILWKRNWKYSESFIIAGGLLVFGFILEIFTNGSGFALPGWPVNLYILVAFLNLLVALHILYKDSKIVKWLASVPAAISSIVIFTFLILLMGFTPQNDDNVSEIIKSLGISHITQSWSYLIISLFFLTTLGMVTLRKIWPLSVSNIGFLLNHAGLWILIATASLGTGDLMRLRMTLYENDKKWIAVDDYGRQYQMPMAMTLLDFDIDEYNPKIGLYDNNTGMLVDFKGLNMFQVEKGYVVDILDYTFTVKEHFKSAEKKGDSFIEIEKFGATTAALIEVSSPKFSNPIKQWISAENFMYQPDMLRLNEQHTLYMFPPEPEKYSSDLVIESKSGAIDTITLEVNKPIRKDGWKIYQLSYDETYGKYSKTSVLELVSDPWIVIVYIGIFMVLLGSIHIFWVGRRVKE